MQVQSSEAVQEFVRATRIPSDQFKTLDCNNKVQPVIEINPRLTRTAIARMLNRTTTGTGAVYTTPTNQDFYLTSIFLGWATDAANDGVSSYVTITQGGASRQVIGLVKVTLVATAQSASVSFPFPVKVDRNTAINLTHAFTVGSGNSFVCLTGYIDETSQS